jgi:predicted SAM-dependent methyltransferase
VARLKAAVGRALSRARRVRGRALAAVNARRTARAAGAAGKRRLEELQRSSGLLLDVGASSAHLPGWISLDIAPDEKGIFLDASKPWPLPDGCARAVRTEHMIEHMTWEQAGACIREIYRVLEPGGLCRICTPDLEGIARAYLAREPRTLEVHREHGYFAPTWSHLPNNYLRMWGHQYVFDLDALRELLESPGFTEIERTGFNQSRHPLLDATDSHDPEELESLVVCVDAVKPR